MNQYLNQIGDPNLRIFMGLGDNRVIAASEGPEPTAKP